MVTRKSGPEDPDVDTNANSQNAPRLQDMRQELWSATDSENSAAQAWKDEPHPPPTDTITSPSTILRPGGPAAQTATAGFPQEDDNVWAEHPPASAIDPTKTGASDIPAVLQPGGGGAVGVAGVSRTVSQTNPFKRKPAPGAAPATPVNVPTMPSPTFDSPAPTFASPAPPVAACDNLSIGAGEPSNNPWKPALDSARQSPAPPAPAVLVDVADEASGVGVWSSRAGSAQVSRRPSGGPGMGASGLMTEEGSPAWDKLAQPQNVPPKIRLGEAAVGSTDNVFDENRQAWGGEEEPKDKGKAPASQAQFQADSGRRPDAAEGWSIIDEPVPGQLSRKDTWERSDDEEEEEPQQSTSAPVASPAKKVEQALPLLPRESSASSSQPPPQPPRPAASDKTETYQVKVINWHDVNASQNPRVTPILVQNANGPCPLVALVNSLTLSANRNITSSLVEALRTREQISLDLLLENVVEELILRTTDRELPDVTELFGFLKGLHTGMNVNPRYYPTEEASKALKRTSLTHLHPAQREAQMPGTFENTREMQAYSTFAIPLIHGWLPSPDDPVSASLKRHAASYEDVQNLLFREEELDQKLSSPDSPGLTEDEQELYHDILTIKSFLASSATQLTPYGLEIVGQSMQPGSLAILFRNDHFSTLYRHPQTLDLLSLVTDAGYATHDEIVWESLVDVNGERAEFFSGDFRLVGNTPAHNDQSDRQRFPGSFPGTNSSNSSVAGGAQGSSSGNNAGWQTVNNRRGKRPADLNPPSSTNEASGPPLSPAEQEDRDLALALQLQEEEDENHRVAEARRRRETQLSQQFIEQQGNTVPVSIAGNRNSSNAGLRPGTASTARRSSNSSLPSSPAAVNSTAANRSRAASGTAAPRQQVVRPLVPPAGAAATPNRARRAGAESEEPPPPTYEEAANDEPYEPPAGHPSHSASTNAPVTGRRLSGQTSGVTSGVNVGAGRGNAVGGPSLVRPLRQGVPPPLSSGPATTQKDRDCVVM